MNPLHLVPGIFNPSTDFNYLMGRNLLEANPLLLQQINSLPLMLNPLNPLTAMLQPQINLNLMWTNPQALALLHSAQLLQNKMPEKIETNVPSMEPTEKEPAKQSIPEEKPKSPPKTVSIEVEEEKTAPPKSVSPVSRTEETDNKDSFWTEENKAKLIEWAVKCKCDWKKVAKKFGNKKITPFLVMTKYKTFTQPNYQQKRVRFTLKEDIQIAKYYKIYGTEWDKIAEHFKGRSSMMLKNRFYSYIRKKNLIDKLLEIPEDAEDYPSVEEPSPDQLSLQNGNLELDSEVKAEENNANEDDQTEKRITTRSMEREKKVK